MNGVINDERKIFLFPLLTPYWLKHLQSVHLRNVLLWPRRVTHFNTEVAV